MADNTEEFEQNELNFLERKRQIKKEIAELNEREKRLLEEQSELNEKDSANAKLKSKEIDKQLENIRAQRRLKKELIKDDEEINDYEDNIFHYILRQNEGLKFQETTLQKNLKLYDGIKNTFGSFLKSSIEYNKYVNNLNVSKLNPKEAHKTIVDMERTAAKLGMRAGKGIQGVNDLTQTFKYLQKETGATADDARNIVEELSTTGYVNNIKEASVAISYFQRATGASVTSTTDLMNELTKVGKFSDRETTTMLANIAKVQQKNGITVKGMGTLTTGIAKATANMKTFGQSDQAIKNMVLSTAKLVSGMEKIGVSAEVAVGWVERLTDPEKIEKNIGLYAQLGMSISDVLSGNIDSDQIGEGMKEFGQKIKDMGPIAGAQFANAFGVSYKDAIKAADFEGPNVQEVEVNESLEALKEMKQATLDASAAMQENINKLAGAMQGMDKNILRLTNRTQVLLVMMFAQIRNQIDKLASRSPLKQYFESSLADIEVKYAELKQGLDANIKNAQSELDKLKQQASTEKQSKLQDLSVGNSNARKLLVANKAVETAQENLKKAKDSNESDEAITKLENVLKQMTENAKSLEETVKEQSEEFRNLSDDYSTQLSEKQKELSNALKEGAALDDEAQKALKDLETVMGNSSTEMKLALESGSKRLENSINKGGDEAGAEIKKNMKEGSKELENDINGETRNMAKKLKDIFTQGANKFRRSGRATGNSIRRNMNSSTNRLNRTLDNSFTQGANKIRNAMRTNSGKGGGGGRIGTVLSMVTMFVPTILNSFFPKFGQWLGKSKVGKFFADLLGIDTDIANLTEAMQENTDATLGNTESNENSGPAQIFRQDNGRIAVKSGTTTTTAGTIINQQTQQSTAINNTTNKSTIVQPNNNIGVESRIDQQINIDKEQTGILTSMAENLQTIADSVSTNKNNVAQPNRPAQFVDTSQQTGHTEDNN